MNIDEIIKYCLDNFQYLNLIESFKEKSLFYNNSVKRNYNNNIRFIIKEYIYYS